MSNDRHKKIPANLRAYGYHPMSLRIWHGMALDAWLRVLRGKWHLISPRRYPLLVTVTLLSTVNLVLKWLSELIHGRKLAKVEIDPAPIFIIGHWRSGTTWLHQIMMLDHRHAAPTRSACFCPEIFLVTRAPVNWVLQRLIPENRPMDNVDLNLDGAEEDEIALVLSGALTSYRNLLFPNADPITDDDPAEMSDKERQIWWNKWIAFLRRVQFLNPGQRLVLKSPPHSLRIAQILQQFPEAKFIHIQRDPYKVFLSNRRTRKAMETVMALQDHIPSDAEAEARMVENFITFHRKLEAGRAKIPEGQFTSLKYEELRADPVGCIQQVYDDLDLREFAKVEGAIKRMTDGAKPYQNNRYDLDEEVRALVDREFTEYFELYGYLPMDLRPTAPE